MKEGIIRLANASLFLYHKLMQLLLFLVILSVVIMIHELGHYLAAKLFGVRVEEFGFGLPPRAIKLFRKWETDFTINWLPIGGFVRLYGEGGEAGAELEQGSAFWGKRKWQRGVVMVAGVVMNFALAVVLFAIVYSFLGIPTKLNGVRVEDLKEGAPAAMSGLKSGEIVRRVSYDGGQVEVKEVKDFLKVVADNKGKEITLGLDGREVKVTPRENPPEGEGALGVAIIDSELRHYAWWQMPFLGVVTGFKEAFSYGREVLKGFGDLISGKVSRDEVRGVVGIYELTAKVAEDGILTVLSFVGILSVNLAILNLIPFPALDGGRVAFLGVEVFVGRRIREKIEGYANTVGMAILLLLMVLVTVNDLNRIGLWSNIGKALGIVK